jgi:truncated hemoglobin YjbI
MTMRAFVSSRIKNDELKEEREIAQTIIRDLKMEPEMWELWPSAMPKSAEEAYLDGVDRSQIYIGIIGAKDSPGSRDEFQRALKLGRSAFVFVKKVDHREPGAEQFLNEAMESVKFAEYSDPKEFALQLRNSLQDFLTEQASKTLGISSKTRQEYLSEYRGKYVGPLLEEVGNICRSLGAIAERKSFLRFSTKAWDETKTSKFVGENSELDQSVNEFYTKITALNELHDAVTLEHKSDVKKFMTETRLDGSAQYYGEVEHILAECVGFFVTDHDDYYEEAKPVLRQLDGALSRISGPRPKSNWIIDNTFKRKKIWAVFTGIGSVEKYFGLAKELLPLAKALRDLLFGLYRSGTRT